MVVGKQVKDCWGKRRKWFSPSYFFPKSSVFIFFPQQPVFPLMDQFSISINDNHHLQCVSYLYTNPVDWSKNSSFKVESFKISWGGYAPPAPPPTGCGEASKGLLGKNIWGWGKEKRRKWFSPFLIFNFNK